MNSIREEIRDLVRAVEKIHKTMKCRQFSHEEKELAIMCAKELITSMSSRHQSSDAYVRVLP
jgi:hypothetical protein